MSTDKQLAKSQTASENQAAVEELESLRQEINDLDCKILSLLNQRAKAALEIARCKRILGTPVFAPEREVQVIEHVCRANPGPLPQGDLRRIYNEIISACREMQNPLKVAFLGPECTFSHQAALSRFGGGADLAGQATIADVFAAVQRGQCQIGLVPVENSSEGGVGATMDCLLAFDLKVCGEVFAPVSHVLMSREKDLEAISRVYSHPQGLSQCRGWLARYMPDAVLVEAESTAAAARRVATEAGAAAVGPDMAARQYELNILAADIQDASPNLTRFLVLGDKACPATGDDKTSLVFLASHRPGSLYGALSHFASRGLNLCRIESRPTKDRPWEYAFFVDLMGHQDDDPMREALEALSQELDLMKVLGSYPSGGGGSLDLFGQGR